MSLIDYESLPCPPAQDARDHLTASALDFTRDQRDALIGALVAMEAPIVRTETEVEHGRFIGHRENLHLNAELREKWRKWAAGVFDDADVWEQRIAFARGERDLP